MSSSTAARPQGVHPGSPEDILRRAGAVPDFINFPSVDDLQARFEAIEAAHPQLVSSVRIATSRLGEPIRMYTITGGSRSHLIVGGVHPNEPIGAWTAVHLAEALCSDSELRGALDATWHIIPCIDPDGTRLNEGWFSNPGDRTYYSRRFYRPAPNLQVEWSFPTDYRGAYFDEVMPETLGLMRALDETEPDLYVALHNAEMGGVYYYLSREVPELYDLLQEVPRSLGLPLDAGEPEAPFLEEFAPAIFGTGSISRTYDYLESIGIDPVPSIGGSSSSEYAMRFGTLSLVAELPYWHAPEADDESDSGELYSDLLVRTSEGLADLGNHLTAFLARAESHLTLETPHLVASRAFAPMILHDAQTHALRAELPASIRQATVAERFSCDDLVRCFRLRYGGMLLQAFEAEVVAGLAPVEIRRLTDELHDLYREWQVEAAEADSTSVIPISSLVGVQYGAILAAASHLAGRL